MENHHYIAKYSELFKVTKKIAEEGKIPTVIYLSSPELNKQLPDMIKSCNNKTIHTIISNNIRQQISDIPEFPEISQKFYINFLNFFR